MRLIQAMCIALLACTSLYAQHPNGLPERATEETERRGPDVEELGTIQAGPDAGVRRAMAPPADDSDKWWVNFIGAGANATDQEKAATKLLLDDIKGLKFKEYVKPEDSANSWSHWQEYREDDPLQQDWLAPIRPKLKSVGLPAIVVQPPVNGKFGPNKTVVCVIGGYNGNPRQFSELIRVRVEAYIHKHGFDGTIAGAQLAIPQGHAQSSDEPIGAKPPFDLPEPIAYPDAKDLPKLTLTYDQIRKKFPSFPPADAAHYADAGLTEQEIIEAEKEFAKTLEVNSKPVNPTPPVSNSTLWDLLPIAIIGMMIMAFVWYVQDQKKNRVDPTGNTIVSSTNASGST